MAKESLKKTNEMSKDSSKVRVVNKTGLPVDTKVYIGRKLIPLSKMFKLGIVYQYDETPVVHLELYAESVDVLGDSLRAVEKVLNANESVEK